MEPLRKEVPHLSSSETETFQKFLSMIAHDLRTPLTVLRSVAQIFELSVQKGTLATQPERTERNCRMMINQVDKLTGLVDQLLDFSRVLNGTFQVERRMSDLAMIVQGLIARFPQTIKVAVPDLAIVGYWDTVRLERSLSEVILAITKLAGASSVTGVSLVRQNGAAKIVFMNRDVLLVGAEKWLESLDLILPQAVIRAHGGTIRSIDESGPGFRVEVELPLSR